MGEEKREENLRYIELPILKNNIVCCFRLEKKERKQKR